MRIAIFGGAFDPPHLGHLQLLKEALRLEIFEQIWLIPTFIPPLKLNNSNDGLAASPENRLEMCHLLIKGFKQVKVLDLEIKRGGKSYTIKTVLELKKLNPKDQFFFLIGSDWIKDLPKWHQTKELFKEIEFISFPRSKISSSKIREKIKNGQIISGLVQEEIEKYIRKHKLYQ